MDDDDVLVRLGETSKETLRVALETNFDEYQEWGFSMYHLPDATPEEIFNEFLAGRTYRAMRVATAGDVRLRGFQVAPTGDDGHYDVLLPSEPDAAAYAIIDEMLGPVVKIRGVES